MNKLTPLLLLLLCSATVAETTLYFNVNGYTLDRDFQLLQFSAIQFTDDRIDAIYGDSDPLAQEPDHRIDGNGQTMIPGLIDAHGHVLSYGLSLLRVDLVGAESESEAAGRVLDFAQTNPTVEWIQGRGWNQVLWDSNEFPQAASLDAVVSDRPVWLTRVDGHAAWANSLAMELAGISDDTEDPVGGQIIRDKEGKATGVFVDTAMSYVREQIPATSFEEEKVALTTALNSLATYGITSVHDAGISSSTIAAYKELPRSLPGQDARARSNGRCAIAPCITQHKTRGALPPAFSLPPPHTGRGSCC